MRNLFLLLVGLIVMSSITCQAAPLPGIWVELSSGHGNAGGARPSTNAVGGKEVAWWGAKGHWWSVDLTVPVEMPRAVLYLRYFPLRKGGSDIAAYLAPSTAQSKDDPAARLLGLFSGDPSGGYRWGAVGAGRVPAGPYKIFLFCPGPTNNEFMLDTLALVPAIDNGLWMPPNRVTDGKIIGPSSVLPALSISAPSWSEPDGVYRLTPGAAPITPSYQYSITNESPLEGAQVEVRQVLRGPDGLARWQKTEMRELKPGETFNSTITLPAIAQSTLETLTLATLLNGKSFHTDTSLLSIRQPVTTLNEMLDGHGMLLPGCYEGDIKIAAPINLAAKRMGDVVLYGSITISNTKNVVLQNLMLRNEENGKTPLVTLSNAPGCQIIGCRLIDLAPPGKSPNPSVLLCSTCSDLHLQQSVLLGNDNVANIYASPNLVLSGNLVYPEHFLGDQYGFDAFFSQISGYAGLTMDHCTSARLENNVLEAPGREAPALITRNCDELQANNNTYWGVINFRMTDWFDRSARTIADWREWSGQDTDSRMMKQDYIRDAFLGCIPDPRSALNGPPNVTVNLKASGATIKPGTTLAVGVFDNKGNLIRTLISDYEMRDTTPLKLFWDGTDNLRQPVSPEKYLVRAYRYYYPAEQSSFANSGGKWEDHIQQDIRGLFVTPDGRCFTNSVWDEGGREACVYSPDGKFLCSMDGTHGWFKVGDDEVTADQKYVFLAMQMSASTDPRDFPRGKEEWFVVARYLPDGKVAPWPEGRGGWWKNMLIVGKTACIGGLAASGGKLYVSDYAQNSIRIFDDETMKETGDIPAQRPGQLALDAAGNFWMITHPDADHPATVLCLDPTGKQIRSVAGITQPTALCIDAKGRLLVADNGPAQQVLIYDVSGDTPRLVDTLGEKGGIYAGIPGQVGDDRFNGLTGVGVDAQGNIYVSSSKSGAELKKFSPAKKMIWNLQGLTFVDSAAADPGDPQQVYTANKRFTLDYSKNPVGWRYTAFTQGINPDDPRTHFGYASTQFARIDGKPFLFLSPMYAQNLAIFRFDGDIAVPAGMIQGSQDVKGWPPNQPDGRWIWRDSNGDGKPEADEMSTDGKIEPNSWNWFVDSKGGIWRGYSYGEGILHLPCQGLDTHGNPIYDWTKAQVIPMPNPFTEIRAVDYIPETDTLYVYGETKEFKRNPADGWGPPGTVLARYDHQTKLRWITPIDTTMNGTGMSVSGNMVFSTDLLSAQVQVFDAQTGLKIKTLGPGKSAGWESGWCDFPMGLHSIESRPGSYQIFNEDDWTAKIMFYQMTGASRETWAGTVVNR